MAPAIRSDHVICDREVAPRGELSRLGHRSRARLTQLMNLLNLARDIEEVVLFFPCVERGPNAVAEHRLRSIAAIPDWWEQRSIYAPRVQRCRKSVVAGCGGAFGVAYSERARGWNLATGSP